MTGLSIISTATYSGEAITNNSIKNKQKKAQIELANNLESKTARSFQIKQWNTTTNTRHEGIYAGFETNPENLNCNEIYNIDIADIPIDVLKYGMLKKLNEIRTDFGLNQLAYDKKLEEVAQDFANEKKGNWRNDPHPHRDTLGRETYFRLKGYGLIGPYIKTKKINGYIEGFGENLATVSGHTINSVFNDRLNSEGHKRALLSPHITAVGFGCNKNNNIIVHVFGNIEKD